MVGKDKEWDMDMVVDTVVDILVDTRTDRVVDTACSTAVVYSTVVWVYNRQVQAWVASHSRD